jgi:hypothetical protein
MKAQEKNDNSQIADVLGLDQNRPPDKRRGRRLVLAATVAVLGLLAALAVVPKGMGGKIGRAHV